MILATVSRFDMLKQQKMTELKKPVKSTRSILSTVTLLLNPIKINEELMAKGLRSTFILRGRISAYTLYWVNAIGKIEADFTSRTST